MSIHDGVIRKTWEVHCRLCEHPSLGMTGQKSDAAAELRHNGWETRHGIWICPVCAIRTPVGTKLNELVQP